MMDSRPSIVPRSLLWLALLLGACLIAGGYLATCAPFAGNPADGVLQRPKLSVSPAVLDQYVGTYRLPSGAHFSVMRDGDRLLGGTPPRELFAETTREFSSNHMPGRFHFERASSATAVTLRRSFGKWEHHCERIDPSTSHDPTIRVSAGSQQLRMLISGAGGPTIVLEDGIGNGIEWQSELQAELAGLSTVVTYDHSGTGGSDPSVAPRDGRQVAGELHRVLQNARLKPPFLLIGGSIGGDYIRIFAHDFPADTAGLILLDPTPDWERLMEWAQIHAPTRLESYRQFEQQGNTLMDRLMDVQEPGRAAEWAALPLTRDQARRAFPLPDVPMVQITGSGGRQTSPEVSDKVRFFDDWLNQHLPQARHVLASHSGHAVTITDRQLVLDEVRRLLMIVRQRQGQE